MGKNIFQKAGDKAKAAEDKLRKEAQDAINKAEQLKKEADAKVAAIAKAATASAKAEAAKLADSAKNEANKALADAKKAGAKVKKNLADLSGKIRVAYKKLLAKETLAGIYVLIAANASGVATLMHPAIASADDIKTRGYKAEFVPASKQKYAQVLSKWKALGGNPAKLNQAIITGSKLSILSPNSVLGSIYHNKPTSNPQTSEEIASMKAHPNGMTLKKSTGIDGHTWSGQWSNVTSDEGNGDAVDMQVPGYVDDGTTPPDATLGIGNGDDMTYNPLSAEDKASMNDTGVDSTTADAGDKTKTRKGFIAWIRSLFHKKDADPKTESPFVAGTPDDVSLTTQIAKDNLTAPDPTAGYLDTVQLLDNTMPADPLDKGDSKVIYKTSGQAAAEASGHGVAIMTTLGILLGGAGGFFIAHSTPGTSTNKKIMYAGIGAVALGVLTYVIASSVTNSSSATKNAAASKGKMPSQQKK